MWNNINNFAAIIAGRRVRKQLTDLDLIPIGARDENYDGNYKDSAITIADFKEQVGTGGGSTTGEYRMSQFADTIVPRTDFDESIVGQFFDGTGGVARLKGSGVFVELENGNLALVSYNQSVLESGILIYEAYDISPAGPFGITGYWIAYKQDPFNKERLIKIGELQMTQQFWDNWYDYTAKDSGPNAVKFVSSTFDASVGNSVESYITKLTWTGSELVAEDIYFDFDGETFQSLYSSLTGITVSDEAPPFELRRTEYILDDDYYGMAMGAEKGWCFYRNVNADIAVEEWISVGYNILTGETKWVNPTPSILALTNFDSVGPLKIIDWVNHPGGLVYSFSDAKFTDNGDNNDGVTAIWSPYWESNTECIYLGIRKQNGFGPTEATRLLTGGVLYPEFMSLDTIFSYYWDNKAFYFWTNAAGYNDQVYIVHKYHIETKEVTSYTLPYLTFLDEYSNSINTGAYLSSWANNDGLFLNVYTFKQLASWSIEKYQYVKHEDSKIYKFHLDMYYPSHAFKDKIYNINTMASYNFDTLGVAISTYKKMKF
jgi:hypothetical protein